MPVTGVARKDPMILDKGPVDCLDNAAATATATTHTNTEVA